MSFFSGSKLILSAAIAIMGTQAFAEYMVKEGDVSLTFSTAGTSDALAVSQGTMQINYVTNGVSSGSGGHALEETGGLHCVGSLTVVQGKFDNESGMCVLTMADGRWQKNHVALCRIRTAWW